MSAEFGYTVIDKADVYRIDIQEVTAKRKKASGEEGNSRDAAFLA